MRKWPGAEVRGRGEGSAARGVGLYHTRRAGRYAEGPVAQRASVVPPPTVNRSLLGRPAGVVVTGVELNEPDPKKDVCRYDQLVRQLVRLAGHAHAELVVLIGSPAGHAIDAVEREG